MKSFSLTDSMQEFWNLIWRGNRGESEGNDEAGQSPGLPWSELEAIICQDVQPLSLETTDGGSSGNSNPAMKWSEDNIRKLVDAFGVRVLNDTNEDEINLVHFALMGRQLKCAALLLDYAAEQQLHVSLHWKGGNILAWASDKKSKRVVEFVLQRMVEQCSSPEETADLLRDNFKQLVKQFPQIMQEYIMKDKFCFEHGRFDVPQSLFANRADAPIAALGEAPSSWRSAEGTNEIKEFWKQKGMGDFIDLDSTSDTKVPAVSKFLCIDLSTTQDHQILVQSLLRSAYPVEVFKTQSIKNFVQWRWVVRVRKDAIIMLLFDVLALAMLFLFAAVTTDDGSGATTDEGPGVASDDRFDYSRDKRLATLVFSSILVARFRLFIRRLSLVLQVFLMTYFLYGTLYDVGGPEHLQFVTSLVCILHSLVLMEDLKPFHVTGPFIAMIGYVLSDIRPFMVLGTLMIVTFGAAFHVLFGDLANEDKEQSCSDEEGRNGFETLWLSFESMFHATLGQFETEVLHSSHTLLSIWRSLLFDLFLFLAAIVLLSLLIAVLGDTCARVMLTREAESIKSRSTCLTGIAPNELSQGVAMRIGTGAFPRLNRLTVYLYRPFPFQRAIMIGLVLVFVLTSALFAIQYWGDGAIVLLVISFGMIVVSLLESDTFSKRIFVQDPLLLRLNSHHVDSSVLVFWFLVPAKSSIPNIGLFWDGRLIAMSRLVSERLKKTEEKQERDIARLEGHITGLEGSLRQQAQRTEQIQDRLARIEGFLERLTHCTS